jgi:hypothetical protein
MLLTLEKYDRDETSVYHAFGRTLSGSTREGPAHSYAAGEFMQ